MMHNENWLIAFVNTISIHMSHTTKLAKQKVVTHKIYTHLLTFKCQSMKFSFQFCYRCCLQIHTTESIFAAILDSSLFHQKKQQLTNLTITDGYAALATSEILLNTDNIQPVFNIHSLLEMSRIVTPLFAVISIVVQQLTSCN